MISYASPINYYRVLFYADWFAELKEVGIEHEKLRLPAEYYEYEMDVAEITMQMEKALEERRQAGERYCRKKGGRDDC